MGNCADAGPRVIFAQAIALHQSFQLLFRRAGGDDDARDVLLSASLKEQRDIDDREARGCRMAFDGRIHEGMDDRLEVTPRGPIGKHQAAEGRPIERAVGPEVVRMFGEGARGWPTSNARARSWWGTCTRGSGRSPAR